MLSAHLIVEILGYLLPAPTIPARHVGVRHRIDQGRIERPLNFR